MGAASYLRYVCNKFFFVLCCNLKWNSIQLICSSRNVCSVTIPVSSLPLFHLTARHTAQQQHNGNDGEETIQMNLKNKFAAHLSSSCVLCQTNISSFFLIPSPSSSSCMNDKHTDTDDDEFSAVEWRYLPRREKLTSCGAKKMWVFEHLSTISTLMNYRFLFINLICIAIIPSTLIHLFRYCGEKHFFSPSSEVPSLSSETIAIEKNKVWKSARSMNWYFFIFIRVSWLFRPGEWILRFLYERESTARALSTHISHFFILLRNQLNLHNFPKKQRRWNLPSHAFDISINSYNRVKVRKSREKERANSFGARSLSNSLLNLYFAWFGHVRPGSVRACLPHLIASIML